MPLVKEKLSRTKEYLYFPTKRFQLHITIPAIVDFFIKDSNLILVLT